MDFEQLAHILHAALKNMPCRCLRRWNHEKKQGFEVTPCSRCAALDAYETFTKPVEAA